jgi:hypothetical protein
VLDVSVFPKRESEALADASFLVRPTIGRVPHMCERADVTKTGNIPVENFLAKEIKDLLVSFRCGGMQKN